MRYFKPLHAPSNLVIVAPQRLNQVVRRFPAWQRRIDELVAENDDFREMCDDYEELAEWINNYKTSEGITEELENHLRLRDSLADEIDDFLSDDWHVQTREENK